MKACLMSDTMCVCVSGGAIQLVWAKKEAVIISQLQFIKPPIRHGWNWLVLFVWGLNCGFGLEGIMIL